MDYPQNIFYYHMHSMLSNGTTNIDSITDFHDYVDAAKKQGCTAFAFSEHGNTFAWLKKKEYIESCGMKYVHAIEAYLTEDDQDVVEKTRDNYHIVLLARNYDGVKEINKLVSKSYNRKDAHFYFMPRITMDELLATSDNIIVTTACLGGVLHNGTQTAKEKFLGFLRQNKHRCFLEIQHHNCSEQVEYNKLLYSISKDMGIPLIAGTDTHALNDEQLEGRLVLQKAKGVRFSGEDEFDLKFKTLDELVAAYKTQNAIPMDEVYEAINNTLVLADMVEPFTLDYSAKYPKLYADSEAAFQKKINEGIIRRKIYKKPNYQQYIDRIHYEYDTYKHNNAIDFMLLEEDYKSEMRRRNVRFGYSRGSVSGSVIAYILGITEVDSVKYNLNFERFMNPERVSLADVDTDWLSEDRKIVKDYLYTKPGLYCCDIVTFNTIALKGAIKDVCRGLYYDNLDHLPDDIKKEKDAWDKEQAKKTAKNGPGNVVAPAPYPDELVKKIKKHSIHKEIPYEYLKFSDSVIQMAEADENEAREKYPGLFRYVDMANGVVVSVGNHPAGCVVSPFPVDEWFGTFTTSTDEYPISVLNMKEIDSLNFVKLDILGLDNIGLIYKTCDLAGIPFLTPDNTPPDDIDVWNSIKEDTTMIFQWESNSARQYLRQLFSDSTIEKIKAKNPDFSYMDLLSIGNGAIRPAGASYRDALARGEYRDNGNEALNDFLAPTLGFLVFQEEVIEFLHKFCGFTMGEADVVRRHFSKKTGTETDIPIIKDGGYLSKDKKHYIKGFIKTMQDEYGVQKEEAERIIVDFLKVIMDASDYLFSKNHSDPYSWIGYICGYLRYHYPLEFITSALNIFADNEEKTLAIIAYAKEHGISIHPIKFRKSTAQYNYDKETHEIYKGIASIKYMNSEVADQLFELGNKTYISFTNLLENIATYTTINSKQLRILAELDFFSEFGDANKLLSVIELFEALHGKKNISKEKIPKLGIDKDVIRRYAAKETEKMYTGVNVDGLVSEMEGLIKYRPRTLADKIASQQERLGYIDIKDDKYSGFGVVMSVDTKYSPKLKVYSLKNGTTVECKVQKQVFNKQKLKEGQIIRIIEQKRKPKLRRTEDGEFEPVPGAFDIWIGKYKVVENL